MSSRPSVRRLAPWILTAALGAAAACGKSGGDAPAKSGDQPAAAAKGGEARPSAADAEARAFSLIVQGYNDLTGETGRSILNNYLGGTGVGPEAPAADKLGSIRLMPLGGPYDRTVSEAAAKFDEAAKVAPGVAEAAMAKEIATAAAALAEAYRQAARYFEAQAYKDDGGAKAAELHAAFMAAHETYRGAVGRLADALDARESRELAAELAKHPPDTYGHWFRRVLIEAKALVIAMRKLPDAAAFTAANEAVQKMVTELEAFASAKADVPGSFAGLRRNVTENFAPRAAKIARDLGDPKVNRAQHESDLDTLVQYYNNLVQMVNSLYDVEAQGGLK